MKRRTSIAAVGTLAALFLLPACGSRGGARGSATPEEAVARFVEALMAGNEDKALAMVVATPEQVQAVRALARYQAAAGRFRTAFIKAYGQEAWHRFNDPKHLPGANLPGLSAFNASVRAATAQDVAMLRQQHWSRKAPDEAMVPLPPEYDKVRVLRGEEGWVIDAGQIPWPAKSPAEAGAELERRTTVLDQYRRAIGAAGITGDDLDIELGRALSAPAGTQPSGVPHRFDIDKLPGR